MRTDLDSPLRHDLRSLTAVCLIAATALAVAMGIGRFAFTPLLPLMARDGSLPDGAGAWLAASNYLGYLAGALTAARLGLSPTWLMRTSLGGIVVTTAAMGLFDGIAAWIVLRGGAGVFSAWALIAVSAWALPHLAAARRGALAGFIYAGVGLGITFTGLFCLIAARLGLPARWLWLELGVLAALAVGLSGAFARRTRAISPFSPPSALKDAPRCRATGLVLSYAALGFGYILPATFLPALAREVWDDPGIFGLAWPVFGVAAALSTVIAARWSAAGNRLHIWATSHLVMAAGVLLPSLWLDALSIAIAALTVGSTFMIATMMGLQEARARRPHDPTPLLAAMTTAFAIGQLAGPLLSGSLELLQLEGHGALNLALQLAALALVSSAINLGRQSRRASPEA